MQKLALSQQTETATPAVRLHYLDWLRVIATLGVFLIHVSDVFNNVQFEIKNAEQSEIITIIQGIVFPWGMPLFFFLAGAGSFFALRRRTPGQFTRERTLRLLIPFLTGTILLGPIQLYFSWRHRVETGIINWSFTEFVAERLSRIGPKLFGAIGYHMWFLGYLFAFSLLALPILMWLKGEAGRRTVVRIAELCVHRGGLLLFILPLVVIRLMLQPFFPVQHDWADFLFYGAFFVLGYLLFCDERFLQAIRRDWWIVLGACLATTLAFGVIALSIRFDFELSPIAPVEFLLWALISASGWCGTVFMLFIGMRFLNRAGAALAYGQETLLPFFVVHQPVIIVIAYYVVQWNAGLLPKMLVVMLGSFVVTLSLCELVIKRVGVLRIIFGMKPALPIEVQTVAGHPFKTQHMAT